MNTQHTTASSGLYLQLVLVSVIWGGTFIAGRILAGSTSPLWIASFRFLIASIVLLLALVVTRTRLAPINFKQGLQLCLLGFFGIFMYNLCFFYGLSYINASRAALIVSLTPAAIALFSYFLFKEKLSFYKQGGIALCVLGAAIVVISKDHSLLTPMQYTWKGDLLLIGCVGSWSVYSVSSRTLSHAIGPMQTVTYSILFGTIMLCLAAWIQSDIPLSALHHIHASQVISLFYLGALGSALAYIWYYDAIKKIGATRSGVFIALNPLTAVLLGYFFLGEHINHMMGIGGMLILSGILLNNWPSQHIMARRS